MRVTVGKIAALLVGVLLVGYCVYYLSPFSVSGIVIVPIWVGMIWVPEFFSDPLPDQIGEKVIVASAWGCLILVLGVVAARWLI